MFDKKKIKETNITKQIKKVIGKKKKDHLKNKRWKLFIFFKWFSFFVITVLLMSVIWGVIMYKKYIVGLPPVEGIKDMSLAQTSIIYDKDNNELYKIFKENRIYVEYKSINKNMINALVAWEDQRFWTTPWFDIIWITRAVLYWTVNWIFTWDFNIKWTSWISQQLMKNTYLSNERKMERKVKEAYLSWKLNKVFEKEKILELYLNKIFFWSNSYWIEQASNTFFWIKASELNILQSSILASLPKAPSWYSPYNHKDKLLWYPYIYTIWDEEHKIKILTKKDVENNKEFLNRLINMIEWFKLSLLKDDLSICWINKNYIKKWSFRVDEKWCTLIWFEKLSNFLNAIQIVDWERVLEYEAGRKDYILWRMLEDNYTKENSDYLSFDEYKKALLSSFGFEFEKLRINIKNPYFVMYIKEYLNTKYTKEEIEQGGFRIYTTLDSKLQEEAEALVEKYWTINEKRFWATNSALISLDNRNWWILAMVWWRDYFDEENWWNNNIITSRLQPWSTFKPFAYALAIKNNPIWSKTPIYDLETTFPGWYTPWNFDSKFKWKMNVSTALNSSRNTTAIKMFYMAWWEEKLITFMEKLWVKTLRKYKEEYKIKNIWKSYSYESPMALWTWLMTPLELAWAYSTFANLWVNKWINPIVKIVDMKWNIIEDINQKNIWKEPIVSPALSYIMNTILSDSTSRPSFWNSYLNIPGRKIAVKTWTSTKQFKKNGKDIIKPRNLWTIWYTPQITTVVWSWNTSGKELSDSWNWLEWAWVIMRDFMNFAHKGKKVENWIKPLWVKQIKISNVSWLLPWEDFPEEFTTSSLFLNTPKKVDNSFKLLKVDTLCDWRATNSTPENAIEEWYLLEFNSIDPSKSYFEIPVKEWMKTGEWKEEYWNYENILTDYNDETCERDWKVDVIIRTSISDNDELFIGNNTITLWFNSDRAIQKLEVYIWENIVKTISIRNSTKKWISLVIPIWLEFSNSNRIFRFRLIDSQNYSYDKYVNVKFLWYDNIEPIIKLNNLDKISLNIPGDINISWSIDDYSPISSIKYFLNKKMVKNTKRTKTINYLIDYDSLKPGKNIFAIIATDIHSNQWVKVVRINLKK